MQRRLDLLRVGTQLSACLDNRSEQVIDSERHADVDVKVYELLPALDGETYNPDSRVQLWPRKYRLREGPSLLAHLVVVNQHNKTARVLIKDVECLLYSVCGCDGVTL